MADHNKKKVKFCIFILQWHLCINYNHIFQVDLLQIIISPNEQGSYLNESQHFSLDNILRTPSSCANFLEFFHIKIETILWRLHIVCVKKGRRLLLKTAYCMHLKIIYFIFC